MKEVFEKTYIRAMAGVVVTAVVLSFILDIWNLLIP